MTKMENKSNILQRLNAESNDNYEKVASRMRLAMKIADAIEASGMTKKEFNKMINLESIFYGIKSLIIGSVLGIGLSYLIYRNNIEYIIYNFEIPWFAIIISAIGITLVITIATIYLKKKLFATDLIETLRKEEV